MGKAHFRRLYEEAVAVDCAAVPLAIQMRHQTSRLEEATGGCFWADMPVDLVVQLARGLVDLRDEFSDRLKKMLLEGKIAVYAIDPINGGRRRIQNPAVIDFDDMVLSETGLQHLMQELN